MLSPRGERTAGDHTAGRALGDRVEKKIRRGVTDTAPVWSGWALPPLTDTRDNPGGAPASRAATAPSRGRPRPREPRARRHCRAAARGRGGARPATSAARADGGAPDAGAPAVRVERPPAGVPPAACRGAPPPGLRRHGGGRGGCPPPADAPPRGACFRLAVAALPRT